MIISSTIILENQMEIIILLLALAVIYGGCWIGYLYQYLQVAEQYCYRLEHRINVGNYNHMVMAFALKKEISPEDEFALTKMAEDLKQQAHALGIEFEAVSRP